MTTKEEVVRNRKKLYPAPKPAISREAFRDAYLRLKLAEKRLCLEQKPAQSTHEPSAILAGQHCQSPGNGSAGDSSIGREDDEEAMDIDEVISSISFCW